MNSLVDDMRNCKKYKNEGVIIVSYLLMSLLVVAFGINAWLFRQIYCHCKFLSCWPRTQVVIGSVHDMSLIKAFVDCALCLIKLYSLFMRRYDYEWFEFKPGIDVRSVNRPTYARTMVESEVLLNCSITILVIINVKLMLLAYARTTYCLGFNRYYFACLMGVTLMSHLGLLLPSYLIHFEKPVCLYSSETNPFVLRRLEYHKVHLLADSFARFFPLVMLTILAVYLKWRPSNQQFISEAVPISIVEGDKNKYPEEDNTDKPEEDEDSKSQPPAAAPKQSKSAFAEQLDKESHPYHNFYSTKGHWGKKKFLADMARFMPWLKKKKKQPPQGTDPSQPDENQAENKDENVSNASLAFPPPLPKSRDPTARPMNAANYAPDTATYFNALVNTFFSNSLAMVGSSILYAVIRVVIQRSTINANYPTKPKLYPFTQVELGVLAAGEFLQFLYFCWGPGLMFYFFPAYRHNVKREVINIAIARRNAIEYGMKFDGGEEEATSPEKE